MFEVLKAQLVTVRDLAFQAAGAVQAVEATPLAQIAQQAQATAVAVTASTATVTAAVVQQTTSLAALEKQVGDTSKSLDAVGRGEVLENLASKGAQVSERIEEEFRSVQDSIDGMSNKAADALDDLVHRLRDARNEWGKELQLGLAALQSGAIDIRKFIKDYGDLEIEVNGRFQKLRDVLASVDLSKFSDRLQDLMGQVRDGASTLTETIETFSALGGKIAEGIAEILRNYQQSEITFAELARQLQQIQTQFEGSDLDNVIDQLLDDLGKDQRRF